MKAVAIIVVTLIALACLPRISWGQDVLSQRLQGLSVSVGENRTVTMGRGETWMQVGMREYAGYEQMRRANPRGVVRGPLLISGQHQVMHPLSHGILLNIPELTLFYFQNNQLTRFYPVSVGMVATRWQTPTGNFYVVMKEKNPTWRIPAFAGGGTMPPGPNNPLGDRLLDVSFPSPNQTDLGIHGTNDIRTIGRMVSHACLRMFPPHIHELFDMVEPGTPVVIVYDTVTVGQREGIVYMSVFPDIYRKGTNAPAAARQQLAGYGLGDVLTDQELRAWLAQPDGVARPLLGSDMPVVINGTPAAFLVGPTRRGGILYLPLPALAAATGAQIVSGSDPNTVQVTRNSKTATFAVNGMQAFRALDTVFVGVHTYTGSFAGTANSAGGTLRITLPAG